MPSLLALVLSGCVSVQPQKAEEPPEREGGRVLLTPPQVLVLELGPGGVPLPRADWTRETEAALTEAAAETLRDRGGALLRYRSPEGAAAYEPAHLPAVRLHSTVRDTILTYRYGAGQRPGGRRGLTLANKEGRFDWTLGETVGPLRKDYEADYALFVTYRQLTSSGGRALLSAAAFFLFGQLSPTSQSIGLASLVDLHNGRVIWTNVLRGQGFDVSKPDTVRDRFEELLSGMPL